MHLPAALEFENTDGRRRIVALVYSMVGAPFVVWLWLTKPGSVSTVVGTLVPLTAITMLLLVRRLSWWAWAYPLGLAPLATCLAGANVVGAPHLFIALLMGPAGLSGLHDNIKSVVVTWVCCSIGFFELSHRGATFEAGLNAAIVATVMHFCISLVVYLKAERLRAATAAAQAAEAEAAQALALAVEAGSARERLMANMTHELRTPLVGIIGMVDLLPHDTAPAVADTLQTVRRSAESLLGIVNDVLVYAKGRSGTLNLSSEPFAPTAVLRDVARSVAPEAVQKGLELFIDLDCSMPASIRGDALRLRQVVLNLVANAIKFTEQGSVHLKAWCENGPPLRLHVSVTDTGIGIERGHLERIFEPFVQVEAGHARRYGGTGLGLSIARDLVVRLGGELTCESTPGRGSTFELWFPLDVGEARVPLVAVPAWLTNKHVLVVAESDVSFRYLERLLSRAGATVARGQTENALSSGRVPDLLLLDVPARVGKQWVDALPSTAMVALVKPHEVGWFESGVAVEKPYTDEELRSACHRALLSRSVGPSGEVAAPRPASFVSPASVSFDVLVVEDNTINARVAVGLLSRAGHRVTLARNGAEGVALANERPFDAIIMDMQMPELDGLSATRLLRQQGHGLPIVMVSANILEEDERAAREAGADAFCAKPFDVNRIQSLLAALVHTEAPAARPAASAEARRGPSAVRD